MHKTGFASLAVLAAVLSAPRVAAAEVTLRAVSAFAEGTQFSKNFERFVDKVNRDGKGVVQINYIGGPRAVPPFEVGNAVRTRVVDMANVTGAFYSNLMPESDAFKLLGKPMSEQRRNGTWDYLNQLHNHKLNAWYLARQFHNVPFHIYLNKKIDRLDFAGLKVRVTPVYRDIVQALGGTPINTAPGEHQRKVLVDAALWLEALDSENVATITSERERQVKAGIQALDFGPEESKKFLDRANDVAWDTVIKRAPEIGAKLRELAGN
jgi:TRAP-type C4-dicarboxylate transport system substrate-binding protein